MTSIHAPGSASAKAAPEPRNDDALSQALRQFSLDVAHDLRGPLAGIGMLAVVAQQHLARGELAEARQDLQRIADQAQLSQGALEALWRLADRLEGPLELRLCRLDDIAQAAAAEAVLSVQARLPGRRLPRLQLQPLGQARVDRGLAHVILVNLIGNALKFNLDHEEVCVNVRREALPHGALQAAGVPGEPGAVQALAEGLLSSGRAAPPGGDGLVLVVSDDGAGFGAGLAAPALELPTRWEGCPDAAAQVSGHGLGLGIVRRAAQRHGGQVQVRSAPGQGTTVRVSIATR